MIGYQIEIKFKRDSNEQFLRASISTDDYLNDDKLEEIVINISNVLKKIFSSSEIKILEITDIKLEK